MNNVLRILVLACTATLIGCATPANQQMMSVTPTVANKAPPNPSLKGAISVRSVSGGQDTNPLWISQVGTQEFKGALSDSLRAYGYLSNDPTNAPILVDANLQSLSQPIFGMTFNVVSVVNYSIQRQGQNATQLPITATGSATISDAFLGVERMRLANERSIKENITKFLEGLSARSN